MLRKLWRVQCCIAQSVSSGLRSENKGFFNSARVSLTCVRSCVKGVPAVPQDVSVCANERRKSVRIDTDPDQLMILFTCLFGFFLLLTACYRSQFICARRHSILSGVGFKYSLSIRTGCCRLFEISFCWPLPCRVPSAEINDVLWEPG
jgi:hypothetical protein